MKHYLFIFVLIAFKVSFGQEIWMQPNRGQWDNRIDYNIDIADGNLLMHKTGLMYVFSDARSLLSNHAHEDSAHDHSVQSEMQNHVIDVQFLNRHVNGEVIEDNRSNFYSNYIFGNDQSKWKSKIYSYSEITYTGIYNGIDLNYKSTSEGLKYSFLIGSGKDVNEIQLRYSGQDKLDIDSDGNLIIHHTFGTIHESKPIAWQIIEGEKIFRDASFVLSDSVVSFSIENSDPTFPIVLDPSITFSSFTGSTADNWGMSAAPDPTGNLFGGGTVFSSPATGYPTTIGAFASTMAGGTVDIGITKFTADGTNLIYSTYLGGSGDETPNSIISSDNGELFIMGLTSSFNFPMIGSPYDNTFNGGMDLTPNANGLGFSGGSDIFVARLSSDGASLIASTYIGGVGTDGMNISSLNHNYGDNFRGEIILDQNNNVFVSSTTQSFDFPTVLGTQNALSGQQDAVIFKMPQTLDALNWSTYYGGSGSETGNSIQVSSAGNVYVTGGTTSSNLTILNGEDQVYGGGISDGYLIQLDGGTGALISSTYIGENEYDQSHFVQLDQDDNVYVFGQTESDLGITAGHYGNANSGQFIWKYNSALSAVEWKTMVGASTGHVEFSPTAFLVSNCYEIYFSGWGGQLNVAQGNASNSTTFGLPVSTDAYQPTTNGSNFYIAVLSPDAMALNYGTFIGGFNSSSNHVDGGTSRFDKNGTIYHSVCGSCGSINNGFSTTAGAWSELSASSNCNMACFKFELNVIEALVSNPDPLVCLPDPVTFTNNSANGNEFFWDFGDNNTSTDVNPSHVYAGPGNYSVTLVVSDSLGCFLPDTTIFPVIIGDFVGGAIQPSTAICPGDSIQLEAFGGSQYLWTPGQYLSDSTIDRPTATLSQTTDFMVIISDSCGIDTAYVTVSVINPTYTMSSDTSICIGNNVQLFVNNAASVVWTPGTYLDDPTSSTPISTPTQTTLYIADITTNEGCVATDSVLIDVYFTPPQPVIEDTIDICFGDTALVVVSGAENYFWSPNSNISSTQGASVFVYPPIDSYYYCDFLNACGVLVDSVFINIQEPTIMAGNDTIICPGEIANLWASGGVGYSWSPSEDVVLNQDSIVSVQPTNPTFYVVSGTDVYGCVGYDSVYVDLFPQPYVFAGSDVNAMLGDDVQLSAQTSSNGIIIWTPAEYLTCVNCPNPVSHPDQEITYTVSFVDQNGCTASDQVTIYYDPIIYVPNTFTPNSDEFNSRFFPYVANYLELELTIYNRWGEMIYETKDISFGWDGTYNGVVCQDGTYTWKIKLLDLKEIQKIYTGHINILR